MHPPHVRHLLHPQNDKYRLHSEDGSKDDVDVLDSNTKSEPIHPKDPISPFVLGEPEFSLQCWRYENFLH
jgi:hypothetical protein